MSLTAAQDSISTLPELRLARGFGAKTLIPDLAFVGLIDDTIDAPIRLDLPKPLLARITAVLGNGQQTDKEGFVPFIVTKLKCQE